MTQEAPEKLDIDPPGTEEWLTALQSVLTHEGPERVQFLLQEIMDQARKMGVPSGPMGCTTPYLNSIPSEQEPEYPGDSEIERKISSWLRWNAVAMVLRAGKKAPELGGHIATYASASTLYEVGFNHFFHARHDSRKEDLIYYQGHCAPGIYARSFLEGRLSEDQLDHFRQEVPAPKKSTAKSKNKAENELAPHGLSSYPHPWLMPHYWQFATVSMGLGPLQGIYQARFLKYLHNRKIADTSARKVWVFCGDGEMDEPESLGAISLASREKLDNLIFVINCNLQRLDGPVRGNGKIIQELEGVFKGAGWNVLKVLWGHRWDPLFAKDKTGILKKRMEECVDGEYQNFKARDGAYVREKFFNKYPELAELVADMSDDEIWQLNRGGHDSRRVYAAYAQAVQHQGQPTVILAKTVKGYGLGAAGEGLNITHNLKKLSVEDLKVFRDRFELNIPDEKLADIPYYRPEPDSPEGQYLRKHRHNLGGFLPHRFEQAASLEIPPLETFNALLKGTGDRHISTTMAFVRFLTILVRDKKIAERVVPIVPDESRTFGMEGLFRQLGIYSPLGQLYEPIDAEQIAPYRESKNGQILQEGINEAGSMCSWIAAGTSYSSNHEPMIPFYIFYSMFGFQRTGDLMWAAADMQAQGFLLGGTSGRTTLAGEGLQHQDGQSQLHASMIPNCVAYDPTFSYELVVILLSGLKRMYAQGERVFYYLTVMNENYEHPDMPEGVEEGIVKGLYLFAKGHDSKKPTVQLLGCGTIFNEVLKAQKILAENYGVNANVWSVTSFNELRKEALAVEHYNNRHPHDPRQSYVAQCFAEQTGPIIAASDYMRLYADQIRPFLSQPYYVLGTDGFGRSDTRQKLRYFFEVDSASIVYMSLKALSDQGEFPVDKLTQAMQDLQMDPNKPNPVEV